MTRDTRESLVDIVVLTHCSLWLDLCIKAVENFTKNPYRLILVGSGVTDSRTKESLERAEQAGHKVVHLAENRSFSHGINAGVQAGSSKYIVILNDDCCVTEGWDTALLQDVSEKSVGLAGARSNVALGAQGDPGFLGEPPFLVYVCVALRREVWAQVGPMDEETFTGFSSEDLDHSWSIKKAGFKLKVSAAYVLHAGSRTLIKTLGVGGDAGVTQSRMAANNIKYGEALIEKWGKDWYTENTKLVQRILVATYSPNEWVQGEFAKSVMALKQTGGYAFSFYHHTRTPIHLARQLVCDYACDQGFDVLVQLDDDATFPPDLIRRLVSHNKDVVCALAYQRKPPYNPCVYTLDESGVMGVTKDGIENTGLRKVDVSGFHCSAIRMSVIKKLRAFRQLDEKGVEKYPKGIRAAWGNFGDKVGEDFSFCLSLKQIGVPVYCDTDLISGHIGAPIVVDAAYKALHKAGRAP